MECETIPLFLKNPCIISVQDFKRLFDGIDNTTMTNTVFIEARIYELLYFIERHRNMMPDKYKKIAPALKQINSFYFENKKTEEYAAMCYMSDSNFRKLIGSGECSVSEAAYLIGFNNMSFFYETMKKLKSD